MYVLVCDTLSRKRACPLVLSAVGHAELWRREACPLRAIGEQTTVWYINSKPKQAPDTSSLANKVVK